MALNNLAWKRDGRTLQRAALRDAIYAWGLERRITTRLEIYLQFAPLNFARWRTHDYDACLRELVSIGCIDRRSPRGIKDREKLRFIPVTQGALFGSADI